MTGRPLLYSYQQRWVNDRSRFKIGMWARQTGKTFATTLEIVDDCYEAESAGRRARWVILSRGERQAKEAIAEGVSLHCMAYALAIDTIDIDFRAENGTSYKGLEVKLPGGSRITALPANPDTARGFSSNVFLDEFAFHHDSRNIWKALFPVISAGHKLRVVSTPNGKGNKFYELMSAQDQSWSRHSVDIHQAVADGLPRDVAALKAALNDEDAWSQEFELKWLDEASAWLSYELISSCEDAAAGDPAGYQGGPCFIGNDIAARNDLWVAFVYELLGDVLWTREIVERRRVSFAVQDAIMDELFIRYRVARLAMDQTGMGEKPVEDAKRRYGASRVDGVLFTAPRKLIVATEIKQRFEDRKIRIPMGNASVRADLHKPRKVIGPTGIPRFVAERDGEGHADRFWAAALGAAAASGLAPAAGETVEADAGTYAPARPPGLLGPRPGGGLIAGLRRLDPVLSGMRSLIGRGQ